nr:hypothetical protein [Campylobacter iguaniorum]
MALTLIQTLQNNAKFRAKYLALNTIILTKNRFLDKIKQSNLRKIMKLNLLLSLFFALFFVGCANHAATNNDFQNMIVNSYCDDEFLAQSLEKVKNNDDAIYNGLNAGLIARNCSKFSQSIEFFDAVEDAYKYDVDLQNYALKGTKIITSTLINENISDYEGSMHERIMLNSYKALNFMSLGDFQNARVEFNRALMRQEIAKEYFANQIEKNRDDLDKNYDKNVASNFKNISANYNSLFREFDTVKDFTNPYATYLASVFFYMDNDYKRASDLLKEIAIIHPNNKEIQKQYATFIKQAASINPQKSKKYIFVIYEDGLGAIKDEFRLTLPFVVDKKIVTTSVAFETLKKQGSSYETIEANLAQTSNLINLDSIIATEFKINMSSMILKSLTSTATKTALNIAVTKNDDTDGWLALLSSLLTSVSTRANVRSWTGLPKSVSVIMIENKGKITISVPNGRILFEQNLDETKDTLVLVRSPLRSAPSHTTIIQR